MNIKKNISVVGAILLSMFVFVGVFSLNTDTASADCTWNYDQALSAYRGGKIKITIAKADANNATAFVENNSDCTFTAETASFKMYDNKISGGIPQSLIAVSDYDIPAHSNYTFVIAIAPCLSQVDTYFHGPGVPTDHYDWLGKIFGPDGQVFNNIPSAQGLFCTNTPPPPPALNGSCSATPNTVQTGNTVTWSATASGGNGSYTYSWTGTDSLTGAQNSISKLYSIAGVKTATVTVTSGSQTVVKNCSATVTAPVIPTLSASCSVNPTSVNIGGYLNWGATASGGNGSYTYSWTGTDGLYSNSSAVAKLYSSAGIKTGTVIVTSGDQTVTRVCSGAVNVPVDQTLDGSCFVNPSSAQTGNTVTWGATASGGNGSYTYSWTGSEALLGSGNSVSKTYSTAGIKNGIVAITSGVQTISKLCTVTITAPNPVDQTLTGSCSVNPTSVNIGGYLNWSATASGGNGSYTYSWTGSDAFIANGSTASKSYSTAGTKTGSVVITSGNQSVVYTCSGVINTVTNNDLTLSCSPDSSNVDIGDNVTWFAYPSGGNGSYSYDWDGTEGLSGSSRNLTWNYDYSGTKRANVTVTSNGQTATASCTTRVKTVNSNLSVSCNANPSNTQVGNRVNWYVQVSGGDGDYNYDWSGTDGLNSSGKSPYITYNLPGSKRATVTVTDGSGDEDSATCYTNVNSVLAFSQENQIPLASAVYLSEIPSTGVFDNAKLLTFIVFLALFSAYVAYATVERKKQVGDLN